MDSETIWKFRGKQIIVRLTDKSTLFGLLVALDPRNGSIVLLTQEQQPSSLKIVIGKQIQSVLPDTYADEPSEELMLEYAQLLQIIESDEMD